MTISPDFDVPVPFAKKQFDGGLFASAVTQMNEYHERGHALKMWLENNVKYIYDGTDSSHHWFEEFIDFETFCFDDDGKVPFGQGRMPFR